MTTQHIYGHHHHPRRRPGKARQATTARPPLLMYYYSPRWAHELWKCEQRSIFSSPATASQTIHWERMRGLLIAAFHHSLHFLVISRRWLPLGSSYAGHITIRWCHENERLSFPRGHHITEWKGVQRLAGGAPRRRERGTIGIRRKRRLGTATGQRSRSLVTAS